MMLYGFDEWVDDTAQLIAYFQNEIALIKDMYFLINS